jgi:hypothetical protein
MELGRKDFSQCCCKIRLTSLTSYRLSEDQRAIFHGENQVPSASRVDSLCIRSVDTGTTMHPGRVVEIRSDTHNSSATRSKLCLCVQTCFQCTSVYRNMLSGRTFYFPTVTHQSSLTDSYQASLHSGVIDDHWSHVVPRSNAILN